MTASAGGGTPLRLALPVGKDAVQLIITKVGYQPVTERVVPDVAQRIRVLLIEERAPGGGAAPAPAPRADKPRPPRAGQAEERREPDAKGDGGGFRRFE